MGGGESGEFLLFCREGLLLLDGLVLRSELLNRRGAVMVIGMSWLFLAVKGGSGILGDESFLLLSLVECVLPGVSPNKPFPIFLTLSRGVLTGLTPTGVPVAPFTVMGCFVFLGGIGFTFFGEVVVLMTCFFFGEISLVFLGEFNLSVVLLLVKELGFVFLGEINSSTAFLFVRELGLVFPGDFDFSWLLLFVKELGFVFPGDLDLW